MVKVENLKKRYGNYQLDISMEIPEGRITGIIGKNGAGKSTTIKSILGLVKADSGKVTVFGTDSDKLTCKDKENIGTVLSDSGFSMYLTAKDVGCILNKMYKKFDKDLFMGKCKSFGLPLDKQIKNYSTGMKAKLRVLSAICHGAKLLILDEPTAGLDVGARHDILDMLRAYMNEDESRSILISSHISSDLEGLCDDIYLIHDGRVLLHEETDRIIDDYAVIKADENEYEHLDKRYILGTKKETFAYVCLTDQKKYYTENYPKLVVQNANIDDVILLMDSVKLS